MPWLLLPKIEPISIFSSLRNLNEENSDEVQFYSICLTSCPCRYPHWAVSSPKHPMTRNTRRCRSELQIRRRSYSKDIGDRWTHRWWLNVWFIGRRWGNRRRTGSCRCFVRRIGTFDIDQLRLIFAGMFVHVGYDRLWIVTWTKQSREIRFYALEVREQRASAKRFFSPPLYRFSRTFRRRGGWGRNTVRHGSSFVV